MKVKPTPPSNNTTKEQYEYLRVTFPNHKVVSREQLAYFIHDVRFDNGGKSWSEVADVLNENQVIHSQWRREDPEWDAQLVCQFAHRRGVVKKHIWRSGAASQVALDLDDTAKSLQDLQDSTEVVIVNTGPPKSSVNVSFKSEGDDFKISGEFICEPDSTQRICFQYEGVPDPHFLQFLHERGLPTTTSN